MLFEVKSNLSPEEVNDVMLTTFQRWINFLLGVNPLGGQMFSNPSGKLAAAFKLQQVDDHTFALYIPDDDPVSVLDWVMKHGRKEVDLKEKMLASNKAHRGKKPPHYRWRDIPIRQSRPNPTRNLQGMMRGGSLDISSMLGRPSDKGVGLKRQYARMWAKEYQSAFGNEERFRSVPQRHWRNEPRQQSRFKMKGEPGGNVEFKRMSEAPGSKDWIMRAVKPMPVYNAGHVLKQMMRGKITSAQD